MYTYQDLLKIGDDELTKGNFCRAAVNDFMGSREYRNAADGESYYAKHNTTIEHFQKFLYTLSGRKIDDVFSSNYKLKTLFFRRLIMQQVQYVLGNGLVLTNTKNKEKLGKDFDFQLQKAAKKALAAGRAFGFWNFDHLEVFGYADTPSEPGFCPLYDEQDGKLKAGIRYWFRYVNEKWAFFCTLYEEDGYTEYRQFENGQAIVINPKRGYKRTILRTEAHGIENIYDENYTALPIITLYGNDTHESELVGIKESIDCYDFIKSGLANDIDDTSGFYWILKNTGGMEDADLAQFIQRMKTVRAAVVDGDQDATAEAHTLDIPVQARTAMLEILRKDIYEDFQALDVNTLSAAAKTTQEIEAAYQAQDNKCADFEYYVLDFVQQILEIAEIKDNPTFVWNRVVNQAEQTDTILKAQEYLTPEIIVKHLPFLTPEEADKIIKDKEQEEMDMMDTSATDNMTDEEEGDEPAADTKEADEVNTMLEQIFGDIGSQLESLINEI